MRGRTRRLSAEQKSFEEKSQDRIRGLTSSRQERLFLRRNDFVTNL